jgi:arylsulfatase A-like enzyme
MDKKLNVIMILIDGARYDSLRNVSSFNELTRLGTTFSKMISYGPQTVTALHALFSGMNGNINGANNYYGILNFKSKSCKTLAQYLSDGGYLTYADVLQDIVLPKQGFDNVSIHDEKKDDIAKRHSDLIKRYAGLREQNKNFFLFFQYSPIHSYVVHNVLKRFDYDDFNKDYFSNKKRNLEDYNLVVNNAGSYLSEMLGLYNRLELFKDTLFVIFSDHGASVGEKEGELGYGRFCYDYTIKSFVTFIYPEFFPPGKEISKLSRLIDIMPTILDVFKINEALMPLKIQGKSLVPLIGDEPDLRFALSEASGIEKKPTNIPPRIHSIRTNNWKLIVNSETCEKELYNLVDDPEERENLFGKGIREEEELKEKLILLSPRLKLFFD